MSEKIAVGEMIIFEEKDNGAWLRVNPARMIPNPGNQVGPCVGGDLLLTEENLIFNARKTGLRDGKRFDITIPLENVSHTLKKPALTWNGPLFDTFTVESVDGEVLAQFKSKKLEEWKMAIEKQASKAAKHSVIREKQQQIDRAKERERALDYDSAIRIWEKVGKPEEAARVRKLKAEQGSVKVDQTVVHGDYIDDRDTIVRDSVISKSSIGSGGKSKSEELRDAKALLDDGVIDAAEFKQMKKEILGK